MKPVRIGGIVLACFGVAAMALSLYLIILSAISRVSASTESWTLPYIHEWEGLSLLVGLLIALPGALLTLVGGILAKPRFLWIIMIGLGIIYCVSLIIVMVFPLGQDTGGYTIWKFPDIFMPLLFLSPGLVCLATGVLIRKTKRGILSSVHQ